MNNHTCTLIGNSLYIAKNFWQDFQILEFKSSIAAIEYARLTRMDRLKNSEFLAML
jgi:hypothetical protein